MESDHTESTLADIPPLPSLAWLFWLAVFGFGASCGYIGWVLKGLVQ